MIGENADARRAYAVEHPADTWEDFSSGVQCTLGFNAGPPFTPSAYNNMQLFQTPDTVVVMTEMVNTSRYPVGREAACGLGRAAVVRRLSRALGGGYDGGRDTELRCEAQVEEHDLECAARGAVYPWDADTLKYEFTVTDLETWTSPWTASVPLRLSPEAVDAAQQWYATVKRELGERSRSCSFGRHDGQAATNIRFRAPMPRRVRWVQNERRLTDDLAAFVAEHGAR